MHLEHSGDPARTEVDASVGMKLTIRDSSGTWDVQLVDERVDFIYTAHGSNTTRSPESRRKIIQGHVDYAYAELARQWDARHPVLILDRSEV